MKREKRRLIDRSFWLSPFWRLFVTHFSLSFFFPCANSILYETNGGLNQQTNNTFLHSMLLPFSLDIFPSFTKRNFPLSQLCEERIGRWGMKSINANRWIVMNQFQIFSFSFLFFLFLLPSFLRSRFFGDFFVKCIFSIFLFFCLFYYWIILYDWLYIE